MRRTAVCTAVTLFTLTFASQPAPATSPPPPKLNVTVEQAPSAPCVEVDSLTGDAGYSPYSFLGPIFEVRNDCSETVQFEVASCRRIRCGDTSCRPIDCSGGPYRIRPLRNRDAGDTSTLDTVADASDASTADTEEPDGDAGPVDASETTADARSASGFENYTLEDLGLSTEFAGEHDGAVVTFDWHLDSTRSGTFRIRIGYRRRLPGDGPGCGCAAANENDPPLPRLGVWTLFALGLLTLRRRRQ